MGKKKAKKEEVASNIDAAEVKSLFEKLAAPEGVVLTSTTPQMKDLGPDGYRYTMWGIDDKGKRCLVVMAADRSGISPKENWAEKYPAMKTVSGAIVASENQRFATHRIVSKCGESEDIQVIARSAQPILLGESRYGYAMMAKQNQQDGFVIMENGAPNVKFTSEKPKYL